MPASIEMSLTAMQATSIPSGVSFGEDERVRVVLKVGVLRRPIEGCEAG